ncbi:beta-1,3-galactosyltransferase 1-like [Mercenaria mercenaria]|uniref:beta-1,3-galactosyltransferase 1-like n=1 Tax=Mercenaria mercenaria TaxID=6596 RepID=UPI00234E505E|nr:beta-1,3-galactosyltransferase 1-like [Mercenaria mercenaria]
MCALCSMKYKNFLAILLVICICFTYFAERSLHFDILVSGQKHIATRNRETFKYKNVSTISPNLKKMSPNSTQGVTIKMPYLLENPWLCSSVANLTVLIIVHTATSHYKHRLAIRETWANNSYYPKLGSVRVLFLLGKVKNASLQDDIEKEFKQHADILQGDFIDSYHNITYKGVMAYKWLNEKCRNAKTVLKVDDDVIVNMFHFLSKYVSLLQHKTRYIFCRRFHNTKIMRNGASKWHVENSVFKNQKFYPDYCQGFVVVISNDIVPALYDSALQQPFFWVDDIYLYGLVPKNISGIQYINMKYGKDVIWGADKARKCYGSGTCPYLAVLLWSDIPVAMDEIWQLMVHNYNKTFIHGQK